MESYQQNRHWSDKCLGDVKRILGDTVFQVANDDENRNHATDLICTMDLKKGDRLACRIRRPGYYEKYLSEFTIRAYVGNSAKTEHEKLLDGWAKWYFYGHASACRDSQIEHWMLIDLDAWRYHVSRLWGVGGITNNLIDNRDGSKFYSYEVTSFPLEPKLVNYSSRMNE